jgi:hypothetical protein
MAHRIDETVSRAGQCFDVAGRFGGIPECEAQAVHGRIEPAFKIAERLVRPEPAPHFLASDDFTRGFEKRLQDLQRLSLKPDSDPLLA